MALAQDPTTVQSPGVHVSVKEQAIANSGLLEYTFKVQLRRQNNITDAMTFQNFATKVFQTNPRANFMPWNLENEDLPDINTSNICTLLWPFKLTHYLDNYNKNINILYGHAKLQLHFQFKEVMEGILPWLRKEIHWIKLNYIQAK